MLCGPRPTFVPYVHAHDLQIRSRHTRRYERPAYVPPHYARRLTRYRICGCPPPLSVIDPFTGKRKPGTGHREPVTANREPRTANREAENREPGTGNKPNR